MKYTCETSTSLNAGTYFHVNFLENIINLIEAINTTRTNGVALNKVEQVKGLGIIVDSEMQLTSYISYLHR